MGLFGSGEPRIGPKELRQRRSEIEQQLQQLRHSYAELTCALEKERAGAQRWEHLLADDLADEDLSKFGLLGWELVSLVSYAVGLGVGGITVKDMHLRYAFKRPFVEDNVAAADLRQKIRDAEAETMSAQAELDQIERRLGY